MRDAAFTILAILSVAAAEARLPRAQQDAPRCQFSGNLMRVPELREGSGLAMSVRTPGLLWAHNDSGKPLITALDTRGKVQGRVQLPGIDIEDLEAVSVGPCPEGSCIYLGDIGDNGARRSEIAVYRVPEPLASDTTTAAAAVFHATYPDGPHDAETLLLAPDGELFIVTKDDQAALYRFPRQLTPGATHRLELVETRSRESEPVTDGAVSADGRWAALRTRSSVSLYKLSSLTHGDWTPVAEVSLAEAREPQGEGITFAPDGMLLLGEGGGGGRAGTFGRATCSFPSE